MNRREFLGAAGVAALGLGLPGVLLAAGSAAEAAAAKGPGKALAGKTLEAALRARQSQRGYADKPLDEALLLELLWAAFGVNRPGGGRTAPSARNRQEMEIYAARKDGLFLYDPQAGALRRKGDADLRALTGTQSYVAKASVNLVYVADLDKAAGNTLEDKLFHIALDTGFIGQNVYLFCAATGLATVARTGIDVPALSRAMGLTSGQRVIMAQCVGHPGA